MALSTIAVVGVATAAAGTVMSYQGSQKQAEAVQQQVALEQQMEQERKKQMELDAMRRKRELIRRSVAAHSYAVAQTTAQGAGAPGSSALGGAEGGISGRTGTDELGINQNLEIGENLFGLNYNLLGTKQQYAEGQTTSSLGSGLYSLGGTILQNAGSIYKVGASVGSFMKSS